MFGHLSKYVTRGNTRRSFTADDPEYSMVMTWATSTSIYHKFISVERLFSKSVASIKPLQDQEIICYRGRKYENDIQSWEQMGPPCPKNAREGRYNLPQKPVLYLSNSEDGVRFEIEPDRHGYFLQKYKAKSSQLRVVDFSDDHLPNLIRTVFDFAESCGTPRQASMPGYAFSNLVARIVQDCGIDAMIVPGVKGIKGRTYTNIVVFNPSEMWATMSLRADGFSFRK